MQDITTSLTEAPYTEPIECILCRLPEMDDLNQCATCLESICASCPLNACSCPGEYGIAAQLKTELREKAIELGKLKAIGRQGTVTDSEQVRIDALNAIVSNLSYELMGYDK